LSRFWLSRLHSLLHFRIRRIALCVALSFCTIAAGVISSAPAVAVGGSPLLVSQLPGVTKILPKLTGTLRTTKNYPVYLPGSTIRYEIAVSNSGARVTLTGRIAATNTGLTQTTIASYFDVAEAFRATGNTWDTQAVAAGTRTGYQPSPTPFSSQQLAFNASPVVSSGVTYGTGVDTIVGTIVNAGAQAKWDVTATFNVPSTVLNPTFYQALRNRIHFETAPPGATSGQAAEDSSSLAEMPALKSIASDVTVQAETSIRRSHHSRQGDGSDPSECHQPRGNLDSLYRLPTSVPCTAWVERDRSWIFGTTGNSEQSFPFRSCRYLRVISRRYDNGYRTASIVGSTPHLAPVGRWARFPPSRFSGQI
jgi:hypothetical protein